MAQPDLPSSELKAVYNELEEEKKDFAGPTSPRSRVATEVGALRHADYQFFFAGQLVALRAFMTGMVWREDLMNAIALNSSMFNGARILGPAVAGILVAWVGEGWCFFVNAVSYIAVIVGLLLMKIEHPAKLSHEGSPLE